MLQKDRTAFAENQAREAVANTKDKIARAVAAAIEVSNFERAESLAKILAILLASERG